MKKLLLALSLGLVGSQVYAGIQNNKVIADVVRIENASLFPIKINGAKVTSGNTCYFRVGTGFYSIENGKIAIELHNGKKYIIAVPVMDKNNGPVIPFGGNLNEGLSMSTSTNQNGELQFEIVVSSDWIFGQKLTVGKNFNKIALHAQATMNALKVANNA